MAPLPEMLTRPKPGDVCLSDANTRIMHSADIAALVDDVARNVEQPGPELERRTGLAFSSIRSSGELGDDHRYQFDGLTDADLRVVEAALMLGLALGMKEVDRGWRVGDPIRRFSNNTLRRWWEDKRPRNADPRTLEALHDLQMGASGVGGDKRDLSLISKYLVLLGYWYSFDDWSIETRVRDGE